MARSAPVASAPRSVFSVSFGPKVTTMTSPRRAFVFVPFSVRRSAVSTAYSSNGFGFHSRPVVSILPPLTLILFALSGSATRLMGTRIFMNGHSLGGSRVTVNLVDEHVGASFATLADASHSDLLEDPLRWL